MDFEGHWSNTKWESWFESFNSVGTSGCQHEFEFEDVEHVNVHKDKDSRLLLRLIIRLFCWKWNLNLPISDGPCKLTEGVDRSPVEYKKSLILTLRNCLDRESKKQESSSQPYFEVLGCWFLLVVFPVDPWPLYLPLYLLVRVSWIQLNDFPFERQPTWMFPWRYFHQR